MPENNSGNRATAGSFLATFALVLVSIVVLFLIDNYLARLDRSENLAEAQRLFEEGSRLEKQGREDEATQQFRTALADDRENRDYQLALARALAKQGEREQALDQLRDLLRRDANDGAANLALARLYAQEGHTVDAASYFHRAIYGLWPAGDSSRLAARFELAGLLVKSGDQKALLAELLSLQDEAPKDIATQKRIAPLYITAGSPARAVTMYRQMLHVNPDAQHDVEVLTGLAEADFANGAYRNAEGDYRAALRLQDSAEARQKLELCGQVLQLDPTQPGIGAKERYERSRKLLEMADDRFEKCSSGSAAETDLVEKAQTARKGNAVAGLDRAIDRAIESNIDLAEQLWRAPGTACANPGPTEPLGLVLAKIAR